MNENVKKPAHYCEGRLYEPRKVIRDWGLNFNLGNVVKYISRAGRKDSVLKDLLKAREYLDFEIEAIIEERKNAEDANFVREFDNNWNEFKQLANVEDDRR